MNFDFFKLNQEIMYSDKNIGLIPMNHIIKDRLTKADDIYEFAIIEYKSNDIIGRISYRIGESKQLFYLGDIGYTILPKYRGNSYAYKACNLIKKFILDNKKYSVIITTDLDNLASRKTCEKLNAELLEIVDVPFRYRDKFGMKDKKCRYKWKL